MSQEIRTVLRSCGLTVGLYCAPPPPGPMMRKSPGRSAQQDTSSRNASEVRTKEIIDSFFFFRYASFDYFRAKIPDCQFRPDTAMKRRDLLKGAAALPALSARADVPAHLWQGFDFGGGPPVRERLNQGPFDIDQDAGWQTVLFTTPSEKPVRNPGLGLVGYTWEESGPSLAARAGRETLEQHVEKMASLPFVDVLYIRGDWRNVQKRAGKLELDPVWDLTLAAAKQYGLRVAFRIQLSNEAFQPEQLALPEFLRSKIPLVKIGKIPRKSGEYIEPRYDHPEFQKAFAELNDLLAAKFDGHPLLEWVDLMQYGFWGEGHTSDYP